MHAGQALQLMRPAAEPPLLLPCPALQVGAAHLGDPLVPEQRMAGGCARPAAAGRPAGLAGAWQRLLAAFGGLHCWVVAAPPRCAALCGLLLYCAAHRCPPRLAHQAMLCARMSSAQGPPPTHPTPNHPHAAARPAADGRRAARGARPRGAARPRQARPRQLRRLRHPHAVSAPAARQDACRLEGTSRKGERNRDRKARPYPHGHALVQRASMGAQRSAAAQPSRWRSGAGTAVPACWTQPVTVPVPRRALPAAQGVLVHRGVCPPHL